VDVVAAAAGEHDLDVLRVEAEVAEDEVVDELGGLALDFGKLAVEGPGFRLFGEVVGVEVEDELRPQPLLVRHLHLAGAAVVGRRVVHRVRAGLLQVP
jgi:hypothetical protein